MASVAWYYGIYAAATAMVTAQDGTQVENHTKTANAWDQHFPKRGSVMAPFSMRVSTLVKKEADAEVDAYRRGAKRNLLDEPRSEDAAWDVLCGYLSGTVEWSSWKKREVLKESKEFKAAGFADFRKNGAKELRDKALAGTVVAFVHQAIRYRGKANYREALYLAHGKSVEPTVKRLVPDMCTVLEAFLQMAGGFVFRRLGEELAHGFLDDIEKHHAFSLSPKSVWDIES